MLKYAFLKWLVLPKQGQKKLKSFKKTRKAKTSKPMIRTRNRGPNYLKIFCF